MWRLSRRPLAVHAFRRVCLDYGWQSRPDRTTENGLQTTDDAGPGYGRSSSVLRRQSSVVRPHITAIFCRSTSLATPLRASASKAENWLSLNGIFSAVA